VISGSASSARPRALDPAADRRRRVARAGLRPSRRSRALVLIALSWASSSRARADHPGLAGVVDGAARQPRARFGVALTPANLFFALAGAMIGTLDRRAAGIGRSRPSRCCCR
jgi:hypothetical protein